MFCSQASLSFTCLLLLIHLTKRTSSLFRMAANPFSLQKDWSCGETSPLAQGKDFFFREVLIIQEAFS